MGLLFHNDFHLGWQPSFDAAKGARQGLLRMDNMLLDEQGALALRLGASTINPSVAGVPTPLVSSISSVHSLFTATLNGVRYRCAGVDTQAFANFGSFASFAGSGDIRFGSHQGMILATRSTDHWKWDGNATRRWGLPAPTAAPSISVLDPRSILVSSFDGAEGSNWAEKEGTTTPQTGQDGTPDGSIEVTPDPVTGRGTIVRTFASANDYDSFDGGAATGALEDAIEFPVWVSHPEQLEFISIAFDCNPNSSQPFMEDYFYFELTGDDAVEVKLDKKDILDDRPDVEQIRRDRFLDDLNTEKKPQVTRVKREAASENAGWSKFRILRGQMNRAGSTPGCDWGTIAAVQLTVKMRPAEDGSVGTVRFDEILILGGSDRTLTGRFKGAIVWARDFGAYTALSAPSAFSDEIECRNNGIRLTIPAVVNNAKDFQIGQAGGQAWAYLGGGSMKSFYRFAIVAAPSTGAFGINCTISERDAILSRLVMETSNQEPPNNIISIIAPHYNCTVVATSTQVWVSRDGNPDSFWVSLDVADPSETILFMVKSQRAVIIATTKDFYELVGSLAELPDGEIDARLEPMGVNGPAISDFVAQDGGVVVYLASDGFRMLGGTGSTPINWNLDLLVGGYTRYGISPLNLGSQPGRFRGGISNGRLYVMVCEGSASAASNIVYVADLGAHQWRREQYPRSFQSLYREPDGKILAGDSSGVIWQLNAVADGDHFGTQVIEIPIEVWTVEDFDNKPFQFKKAFDWRADLITGTTLDISVALYMDGVLGYTMSVGRTTYGTAQFPLGNQTTIPAFKRVQHRITGSVTALRIGSFALSYRERPIPMLYWDSTFLNFGPDEIIWFREIEFKARCPVDLAGSITFDGETRNLPNNGLVEVRPDLVSIYSLLIGRECKGRQPLIVLQPSVASGDANTPNAFELYWIRITWKGSGKVTEKTFVIKDGGF